MLSAHSILIPATHIIHDLVTLFSEHHLFIEFGAHTEVLTKLAEGLALLRIVLLEEGKHVLVFTDEVIVDHDFVLILLFNFIDSPMQLSDHICVTTILHQILAFHKILLFLLFFNLSAAVTPPFNAFAEIIVVFLKFSVISVHELSNKPFKLCPFFSNFPVTQRPCSEIEVLRVWINRGTAICQDRLLHDTLLDLLVRCSGYTWSSFIHSETT